MTKARGKLVRRFGINIFGNQKYDRLLKRRPGLPGNPKKGRPRVTEYGKQLMEKQKLKFSYGLSEKQFHNVFEKAKTLKGVTGHNMLILLERRLDNVVYRLGMANSRIQARQIVSHGHIYLNGRRCNIPSAVVRTGDVVQVKPREASKELVRGLLAANSHRPVAPWLALQADDLKATISAMPTREMIPTVAEEQQIVEFYSK
jgi:small subunit ribosomal protein S4